MADQVDSCFQQVAECPLSKCGGTSHRVEREQLHATTAVPRQRSTRLASARASCAVRGAGNGTLASIFFLLSICPPALGFSLMAPGPHIGPLALASFGSMKVGRRGVLYLRAQENNDSVLKDTPTALKATEKVEQLDAKTGTEAQLPFSKEIRKALSTSAVEIPLALNVLLSCAVLSSQSVHDLSPQIASMLQNAETVIYGIFFLEFSLRWYSREMSPRFLAEPETVVDLVACLPFFLRQTSLDAFSGLFFVRLLRVLKLQRYLQDIDSFKALVGPLSSGLRAYHLEVAVLSSSLLSALFITAGVVYSVESPYNPQLSNYFQCLYFAVTTLTTVGFGDVTPITDTGKAVVTGAILASIGVVPYQISRIAETVLESGKRAGACPRCGERAHPTGANYCCRCGLLLQESTLSRSRPPPSEADPEASDLP